jgi:hypothetical protein
LFWSASGGRCFWIVLRTFGGASPSFCIEHIEAIESTGQQKVSNQRQNVFVSYPRQLVFFVLCFCLSAVVWADPPPEFTAKGVVGRGEVTPRLLVPGAGISIFGHYPWNNRWPLR